MNVSAETERFDPAHVEKWLEVSRAYLAAPLAELCSDSAVEDRTRCLVPQIRGDRSVLALRMNACICQPEMLLQEAASVFSGYLDGIRVTAKPLTMECVCQGSGVS